MLVTEGWRRDASEPLLFPAGAAVLDDTDRSGWCLVAPAERDRDPLDFAGASEDPNPRGWLGGAIIWATRNDVHTLSVLLDHVTSDDARRAALFVDGPRLWRVIGRSVVEVPPLPYAPPAELDAVVELFRDVIVDAGADAVVEHGVLRAEYLGLEVGRVVVGEDDVPRLDVGVGKHDRLANAMLGNDRDVLGSLRNAIASVARYRRPGAPPHPANQLVPARWMRALAVANPSLVVAGALTAVEGTEASTLKRATPAIAVGEGVVVAFGVGSDLDAIAFAADARAHYSPEAELVMVFSDPDAIPAQRLLIQRVPNARLVTLSADWRDVAR